MSAYAIKRIKSFAWNMGAVALVGAMSMLIEPEFAESIGLTGLWYIIAKEVVSQVTKWLNTPVDKRV